MPILIRAHILHIFTMIVMNHLSEILVVQKSCFVFRLFQSTRWSILELHIIYIYRARYVMVDYLIKTEQRAQMGSYHASWGPFESDDEATVLHCF